MHTRAEWKVLPFRQPARGAAARSASLDKPESMPKGAAFSIFPQIMRFCCYGAGDGSISGTSSAESIEMRFVPECRSTANLVDRFGEIANLNVHI